MNPFTDRAFNMSRSETFGAVSNLAAMLLAAMPTLYGSIPAEIDDFLLICIALLATVVATVIAAVQPIFGLFGFVIGSVFSICLSGIVGASALGGSGALTVAATIARDSVQELVEDSLEEMAEADVDIADGEGAALLGVGAVAFWGAAYYAQVRAKTLNDGVTLENVSARAILKLALDFKAAGAEASEQRTQFEMQLTQDLALAAEVPAVRIDIKKMSSGSIMVDSDVLPDTTRDGSVPVYVVQFLEQLAADL